MGVYRPRLRWESHFTQVPNSWLEDDRLTPKAMWMLAFLLRQREDQIVSTLSFTRAARVSKDAIYSGFEELESCGYLIMEQERQSDGRLGEVVFTLLDPAGPSGNPPQQENPEPAGIQIVSIGNPDGALSENPTRYKTGKTPKTDPASPSRAKAKHRMTEDFPLTPEMQAYALAKAPAVSDVARCFEEFRNYWIGQGTARADWAATWRNWVLKRQEYAERDGWKPPKVVTRPSESPDFVDDGLRPVLAW